MSSHHIVREKQEPALIIMSYNDFNDEYLGQLLEWSPTVFVFENEWDLITSKGIKIDAMFAPSDNINEELQEFTRVIPLQSYSIKGAIDHLISESFPSVNIIGSPDLLQEIIERVHAIDIVLFYETHKYFPVKEILEKWYAKGEELSVINLVSSNQYSVEGLTTVNDNLFVTSENGMVKFKTTNPSIFVVEELK
ncbi:hypothetical protein [Solitalea canadensis]|uniref:Thiamine pyrophosphokinase n=1 Tax=Solitalea canadensis (strain ATCC 29591 / DSM 3403 / JCM 21819 / LMG 8368 / NBRC 15130 / NCIMB 12057 / USAM 9D) TaxID=929556 RepID=H8KSJ1_SOLCM|nr:hypothetical protein [Solitalea canadensis]AFD08542.1 hypothetical protein Solca_3538 [Solitalea canadensis DSM 3403]